MSSLVTIRLHGPLKRKYGGIHRFAIRTPREAISALDANYPGFRAEFLKTSHYSIFADGDWRTPDDYPDVGATPISRQLDICPVVEGRVFAPLVAAFTWLGASAVVANILAGVTMLGLLIGVSLLLSPKVKKNTSAGDDTKDENYMFSGPENVTTQGAAVPLIYGRCMVGSVVVSAGLEVAEGTGNVIGNNWSWTSMPAALRSSSTQQALPPFQTEAPPAPATPPPPGRTRPPWIPENA